MANYSSLIAAINAAIKQNGNQEITGPVLNSVLNAMVSSLGNGWQFGGVVTPSSAPGSPDQKMFYLAWTPGAYTGFGGMVLGPNELGVFTKTGSTVTLDTVNLGGGSSPSGSGTYVVTDLELLDDSATSMQIDKAIGGFDNLVAAIQSGAVVLSADTTDYQHAYKIAVAELGDTGEGLASITILDTSKLSLERYTISKSSSGELSLELFTISGGSINSVYTVRMKGLENTSNSNEIIAAIGSWPNLFSALSDNKIIMEVPTESEPYGSLYICHIVTGTRTTGVIQLSTLDSSSGNYVLKTYTISAASAEQLSVTVESVSYVTHGELTSATLSDFKTASKTIPGAVNELFDAVGQPTITKVDLSDYDESGYWTTAGTKASSSSVRIKHIALNTGDLLVASVLATSDCNIITIVNGDYDAVVAEYLTPGTMAKATYPFLATSPCFVALSFTSIAEAYIVKSAQNLANVATALSTATLHKVYEEYGAVYNKETGYWELNGLTDLTEEDMWDIYLAGVPKTENLTEFYGGKPIRTTFNFSVRGGSTGTGAKLRGTFIDCVNIEIVQFYKNANTPIYVKELLNVFFNCQKLREIVNIIQIYSQNALVYNAFYNCKALKSVKLKSLGKDISFKDSPLLSYDSLNYLVTNATNTAAITVTVHPTTYSYLTGTAQPSAEVGGTSEEWQALLTTAQGKQISFAQPAETLEVEPLE